MIISIYLTHLRKHKFICIFFGHRHTYKSLCITCHEIYIFICGKLCSTYYISLIFSFFIINHYYDFSCLYIFQDFINSIKFIFHNQVPSSLYIFLLLPLIKTVFIQKIHRYTV